MYTKLFMQFRGSLNVQTFASLININACINDVLLFWLYIYMYILYCYSLGLHTMQVIFSYVIHGYNILCFKLQWLILYCFELASTCIGLLSNFIILKSLVNVLAWAYCITGVQNVSDDLNWTIVIALDVLQKVLHIWLIYWFFFKHY